MYLELPGAEQVIDPPVAQFDELHHVGSLDQTNKWDRGMSYEGSGLSVSRHPEEWKEIARLGGAPTHTFNTRGLGFVDFHEIPDGDKEKVLAWAQETGLIAGSNGWTISWFDDELDSEVSFVTTDPADAEFYRDEEGHDVVETTTHVSTDLLHDTVGFHVPNDEAADQAMICYFESQHPEVAGVWWEDTLDPDILSAPRGVVFQRSIGRLTS